MSSDYVKIPVETAKRIASAVVRVERERLEQPAPNLHFPLTSSLGFWAQLVTCNSDRTKWTWYALAPQDDGTMGVDGTWGFSDNYDKGYAVEVNQYKFMFEGDRVWMTPAKNEEYYVFQYQPIQHYCTITGTGYPIGICDPTTGWHSNATIFAYSPHDGSIIHNIGGKVQSSWQSSGIDWTQTPPALAPGRKFSLWQGISKITPCTFIKWDTSSNQPIVEANPGQQTYPARVVHDTSNSTNGLVYFEILGTGGLKVNAWCLTSLNVWINGLFPSSDAAVLPAGTPVMLTETEPGTFYAVVTPQNPVAYIPQTYPYDSIILKKLAVQQPLGEGSDLPNTVTVTFPTNAGMSGNPGVGVTLSNGTAPNPGVIGATSQGFTGMDVSGHAAVDGIVGP